jgi:hypothetical protein
MPEQFAVRRCEQRLCYGQIISIGAGPRVQVYAVDSNTLSRYIGVAVETLLPSSISVTPELTLTEICPYSFISTCESAGGLG